MRTKAVPRKKACQGCVESKVRCNLEKPICSRCKSRRRPCRYPGFNAEGNPDVWTGRASGHSIPSASNDPVALSFSDFPSSSIVGTPAPLHTPVRVDVGLAAPIPSASIDESAGRREIDKEPGLDLTNVDLVSITDAEEIRDRWLRPFLACADQVPKDFHPHTLQYLSCVLGTYPKQMIRPGGVPPIIHPLQVSPGPHMPLALANCYSLVRMWENRAAGSEAIVATTVQGEMERLIHDHQPGNDVDRLSAFQAYLIYCILAYFDPIDHFPLIDDSALVALQEMAFRTARNGLVCTAELARSRPTWESWIVVSAKRRATFAMYLFSSVYNADRCLPNFVAQELQEVYVPESKSLWAARTREAWEREYDRHLARWTDGHGMLRISELWMSPETGSKERRDRIRRWLQSADEFGMMLFSVCAHIHGC